MDPLVNRVVARYRGARAPMEQNLTRNAKAMLEEIQEAETRLHRAEQFSRQLRMEPSLEWIVDQLEEANKNFSGLVKSVTESLDYLTRP